MSPPRLLIVNPNTNEAVAAWLEAEARRVAGGAFAIAAVCAPSDLAAIETPEDVLRAAVAVVSTLAAEPRLAGAVIGAFGDPGLDEARAALPLPVVGLGEAGILAAAAKGRFAIVTLGAAMRAPIAERAAKLGVADRLADVAILPVTIAEMVADRGRHRTVIRDAIRNAPAPTVLMGGAPFAGLAAWLSAETGTIVLDGVEACIDALRGGRPDGAA